MSKSALGLCYKSITFFRIGEFVAKVLNSSKFLPRIPDRLTNCKNIIQLRYSRTDYVSATNSKIVAILGIRDLCGIGNINHFWAFKNSLDARKPVFRVSEKVIHKPNCLATETTQKIESSFISSKCGYDSFQ